MKKTVFGILAHVDAGKTTLAESILFLTGKIRKQGRVDSADTALDTHSLEKQRGITIFAGEARFTHKSTDFTMIDTPGHVDFSAETERVIRVLDCAVLAVSSTDGVQSHTRTLMNLLATYQIPTFIFVTKCDYARKSEDELLKELNREFGTCIKYNAENEFADSYEDIASASDTLMEEYFESGEISKPSIVEAIRERQIFPCVFGSGLKNINVDTLLDLLDGYTPEKAKKAEFSAKVFKITRDKADRLTHLKITGGTLCVRDKIVIGEREEKIAQIRIYSGTKFDSVNEVSQGEVCCVTGLSESRVGMGLGDEKDDISPYLEPVMQYRISLPEGTDAQSVYLKIKPLEDEEPLLRLKWIESIKEIQVQVMGEVQIQVLEEVLRERFGIEATLDRGRVVYKETIDETVIGVGHYEPLRHYSEVHLRLEVLPRGSGMQFSSECSVNELNTNWQRLILTNLAEKEHLGVLTGSPITDIKITVIAGRDHIKHTEGGDFRQSTYRGVRQGLMKAKSRLLEPYYRFAITLPLENAGRAITDIRSMHGTCDEPEYPDVNTAIIKGLVPVSTVNGYSQTLASYTSGKGSISLVFDGYGDCHNAKDVIEEMNYDPCADLENSPDSIFCAHGAGFPVKWNEVESYMHIK